MQPDILGDILRSLVTSIPSIVVYSLGIIFALVQMRKAPKAAVIVVISLTGLGLLSIAQPFVFVFLGRMKNAANWFSIVSLLFRFAFLAAVAGLILAVFCDRGAPPENVSPYAQQFGNIPTNPNPYAAPKPLPPQ
ncbi:MAG: hypothetical protein ACR2FY_26080 [Pirellulaceae bacterium]